MFSNNGSNALRVNGTAEVGHFVTYFDMANQTGEVFAVTAATVNGNLDFVYSLRSTETGAASASDLRQHGWTFV